MLDRVEVLQVSSLEDYDWPENDPHSVPQRTRTKTPEDLALIRRCLQSAHLNLDEFEKNAKKFHWSKAQTILNLISHQKYQMNPVTEVRNETRWLECIQKAIDDHRPIELVYPQCCVIPNAPKRYTNMGTAAGEDCMIEFFKLINKNVTKWHEHGLVFHLLADAALYASAFQTHQTEVDAYYHSVRQRIEELDACHCIKLHNYSELLRTKCHPDYQRKYYEIGHEVWPGDPEKLLPHTDVATLRRSVRCSVNTRRFQLGHTDHMQLFGPTNWRSAEHPYHNLIEAMTEIGFREVITIRLACTAIDISTRLWPDAIRATVHKGQKNGRWAVGLRPYPEYYGSCKILPYHGMPIISRDSKKRAKLEIAPEVLLRGRTDLIRVTFENVDEVYAYIAEDIDEEINGKRDYPAPVGMREIEFERPNYE